MTRYLGLPAVTANPIHQPFRSIAGRSAAVKRDARGPLHDVRESLTLVRDAKAFTPEQRLVLDAAIDHCDRLEQLIKDVVDLSSPPQPAIPIQRRKVAVTELRTRIEQLIRTRPIPSAIDVLWDGSDDPGLTLLVDPDLLCGMVELLVARAVHVTPRGRCVLIRMQVPPGLQSVRWSVIDQGPGMTASDVERMFQHTDDKAGFSLSQCRAIAALHCSSLDVDSTIGGGTEISFTTPRSGPREFALAWSQWRLKYSATFVESDASSVVRSIPSAGGVSETKRIRVDGAGSRLGLPPNQGSPQCPERVAAGTVVLGAAMSHAAADQFDRCLQQQLAAFDFAYRAGVRRWIWAIDADEHQIHGQISSITAAATAAMPALRINWSPPRMIPIDARQTYLRLSELLIREVLSRSAAQGWSDKDQVRLGTAPLQPSSTATERLNDELQRLAKELQKQTSRLERQARHLRWQG